MNPADPPPIIDTARVLCFAHVGSHIRYTGRIHLYFDGERVGPVPCLAICRNYYQADDILLVFCDAEWSSKGVIPFSSVEEAKTKAERGYAGISAEWHDSHYDDEAVANFIRDEYNADPNTEWWRFRCSFCREDVQGACISKGVATICRACIATFHATLHDDV